MLAPMQAEAQFQRAIRRQHYCRKDRVTYAFAGRGMIWVALIHLKIRPAIMKNHTGLRHDDPRSEDVGNTGDEGDDIAIAIGDGEVGRVAVDATCGGSVE